MSDPIDQDKAPDTGMDVFNMKPSSKPDNAASQPDAATSRTRVEGSGWALKVGPVHFAVVAVLIAGAWIGWPYMSGGSAASSQLATSSQVLMPTNGQMAPTRERPAPPNAKVSNAGHAVRGPAPMAVAMPGPAPAVMPASMPAQLSAREMELQATVAELQSKLALAEAQAAARTPPGQTTVVESTTSRKPQSKLHDVGRSRRVVATRIAPGRNAGPTLRDYTLNTVYREQAWIQGAERTYVVRAGDVIDDVRIVRIDPRARQVVTSRGVIR